MRKNAMNYLSNLETTAIWAMNNIGEPNDKVSAMFANEFAVAVRLLSKGMDYDPEDDEFLINSSEKDKQIIRIGTMDRDEYIRNANLLAEQLMENVDTQADKVPPEIAYWFVDVVHWLHWYIDYAEDWL